MSRSAPSTTKTPTLETLPNEILDIILLFVAGSSLQSRSTVQSVCRLFRCLVVLNTSFQTDLASLPVHPPAFSAYFNRAHSLGRPFHLVLDYTNKKRRVPPLPCLLSGVVFAQTIVVQHSLSVSDVVAALVRQPRCEALQELVLEAVGNFVSARQLMLSHHEGDGVLSLRAPLLKRLELQQIVLNFPETFNLRRLKIEHRNETDTVSSDERTQRAKNLHSILRHNPTLESVELIEPVGPEYSGGGPSGLIPLPALKEFKLSISHLPPAAWLLSCLTPLPSDAYVSITVGEGARESVDIVQLADIIGRFGFRS
ncbi:unnamed protein product [Peniophora sp. CBMAI 1063]|nr:unnamed protein product [Peniophora sp. CBMAI 1063]